MRIATRSWAWALACLAFLPSLPGAAGPPGSDSWVILPGKLPPFSYPPEITTDSARNLYFHGREGVFLLEAGSLRPLPLPEIAGFQVSYFLALSPQDYWVNMFGSGEDGKTLQILFRRTAGEWTRYDSAAGCSQGIPLGLDAAGNPILQLRKSLGFATISEGLFRVRAGRCQAIPLGLENISEKVATRYFRDKRGREYFALNIRGDKPGCAGFVRLGDTLERFETMENFAEDPLDLLGGRIPLCVEDFEESGDTVFLAAYPGLGILVDTNVTVVRSFRGVAARIASDVLRDSRGYLWLGTEGYDFTPPPLGLVRIKGSDTTLFHKQNSDLPTLYPRHLWEDKAGNIWVEMFEGGFAVQVREGNLQPLSLAPRGRRLRSPASGNEANMRDILGRKADVRPFFRYQRIGAGLR